MKTNDHNKIERTDKITQEGLVIDVLPNTMFKVQCGKSEVLCTLSGKLRQNKIKVLEQDRVKIEVSPYDLSRGRIIWRSNG